MLNMPLLDNACIKSHVETQPALQQTAAAAPVPTPSLCVTQRANQALETTNSVTGILTDVSSDIRAAHMPYAS